MRKIKKPREYNGLEKFIAFAKVVKKLEMPISCLHSLDDVVTSLSIAHSIGCFSLAAYMQCCLVERKKLYEVEQLGKVILNRVGDRYTNIEPSWHMGGTKCIFTAVDAKTQQDVIIKIDKSPSTNGGIRHCARGYTITHEIDILEQLPDKEDHHLPGVLYFEKESPSLLVERYRKGPNLFDFVEERKEQDFTPFMTQKEFRKIFSDVLDASVYLENYGYVHRDISPANIIICKNGNNLESFLVDLANASRKDDLQIKTAPTAGAQLVNDPLLFFSNNSSAKYNTGSECYSIGKCMLYALRGWHFDIYLGDNHINADFMTVFEKDGVPCMGDIDKKSKNLVFHKATKYRYYKSLLTESIVLSILGFENYSPIIERCLTLDKSERYNSVKELSDAFNAVS